MEAFHCTAPDRTVLVGADKNADIDADADAVDTALTYDTIIGVDDLVELSDHKRDRLDALDLLLRADELPLEVLHLVLDVLLLRYQIYIIYSSTKHASTNADG